MVDFFIDLVALFLFFSFIYIDIYFFPFFFSVSVYMYVSLCDFVCIALLLPFVLGFSLFYLFLFFSILFSASYHWWICFVVSLLSSFFLFFITF